MKVEVEGEMIKSAIGSLQILLDEGTISFNPTNGMTVRGIESTKSVIVDMVCLPGAFKTFDVKESVKIPLYITELWKIIKKAGNKDTVEIIYDKALEKFEVVVHRKFIGRYKIKMLPTFGAEVPSVKSPLTWTGKFVTTYLNDALTDLSTYTSEVYIKGHPDKLLVGGIGDRVDADLEFKKGGEALLGLDTKSTTPVTCLYGTDYLSQVLSAGKDVADTFIFAFATGNPAYLSFTVPTKLKVQYWIAPRIEKEPVK